MRKILITLLEMLSLASVLHAQAGTFNNTPYQVCFTPGGKCTNLIVDRINDAKKTILVQAYSFTSKPIVKALVDAEKRGVKVTALLDKSNATHKYSGLGALLASNIPTKIDYKVSIAHNKVMIIDGKVVMTGSFNFTRSAQVRNAENSLIIDNKELAQQYTTNFWRRWSKSESVSMYCSFKKCKY